MANLLTLSSMVAFCALSLAPNLSGQQKSSQTPAPSAHQKAYRCIYDSREGKHIVRYSSGPILLDRESDVPELPRAWTENILYYQRPADRHGHVECVALGRDAAKWNSAVDAFEQKSKQLGIPVTHIDPKTLILRFH